MKLHSAYNTIHEHQLEDMSLSEYQYLGHEHHAIIMCMTVKY
jgi:hypothetical protein